MFFQRTYACEIAGGTVPPALHMPQMHTHHGFTAPHTPPAKCARKGIRRTQTRRTHARTGGQRHARPQPAWGQRCPAACSTRARGPQRWHPPWVLRASPCREATQSPAAAQSSAESERARGAKLTEEQPVTGRRPASRHGTPLSFSQAPAPATGSPGTLALALATGTPSAVRRGEEAAAPSRAHGAGQEPRVRSSGARRGRPQQACTHTRAIGRSGRTG